LQKEKSCAFTGYRPEKFPFELDPYSYEYKDFMRDLQIKIIDLIMAGVDTFYCGCARGFDIIAGEVIAKYKRDFKIKLIAVVPFPKMAEDWSIVWQIRLQNILAAADEKIVISDEYKRGVYSERNRYMVDNSEYIITYFDGQKGGTETTLNYAKKKGLTVFNISKKLPPLELNKQLTLTYYIAEEEENLRS